MVGPCRVREVGGPLALGLVELGEEEGTQVDGTSARDGLQAGDLCGVSSSHDVMEGCPHPLLLDGGAVTTEHELLGGGCELGETSDREVLVVEIGVVAQSVVGLWGMKC